MAQGFTVVDLFSGGGGMSYGFHAHPSFTMVGAADAQLGKPSSKRGSLACNSTYALNIGVEPVAADLSAVEPARLKKLMGITGAIDVLSACPPCTGFSRTNSQNHLTDDVRNSLVPRVASYVKAFDPSVVVMENARELLMGNFREHFLLLERRLTRLGYSVSARVHMLNKFGLPQLRERAIIFAVRNDLNLRTLDDLWQGHAVAADAISVKTAIGHLPALGPGEVDRDDPEHASPRFVTEHALGRIAAIPSDGGSWRDLIGDAATEKFLTPAMHKLIELKKLGNHPDVYGRMAWNRPAPTIKRECGHVGNGRYAHPVDNRLCSLRELAILNGFPADYRFGGSSLANKYRHVGDAVPPMISYQIACAVDWSLTGERPLVRELPLAGTSLRADHIVSCCEEAA
ncbi:C-5 cytosine-specific DNA methylase [Mycolicibacterium rhodesiae JS60]|nr:C-5 cytosine-specific DNA methylase [Mycolicibacterium rhodesiae JS60]